MSDVDLLLLHARRLSHQTRVVVGAAVGGAHGVLVVAAAVDVADAPEGRSPESERRGFTRLRLMSLDEKNLHFGCR